MERMIWNSYGMASVKASAIRQILILPDGSGCFTVRASVEGDPGGFFFGDFDTQEDAKEFVEGIHRQIEEGM